jgi:hypothetical protein
MTDVHVVVLVFGGVISDVQVFETREKAVAYIKGEAETYDLHKVNEARWESGDEEDDMTLWKLSIQ